MFWLSSSPDARGAARFIALHPPFDKLVHAGAFGVLALLFYVATGRVWLSVLLASLYGATDELHQGLVPGRAADVRDWLADCLGALAGVGFGWGVGFLSRRSRAPSEKASMTRHPKEQPDGVH